MKDKENGLLRSEKNPTHDDKNSMKDNEKNFRHNDENENRKETGECSAKVLFASIIFFVAGIIISRFDFNKYNFDSARFGGQERFSFFLSGIFYLIAYLLCGRNVILSAFRNLSRKNVFNESFLIVIASLAAILIEEFSLAVGIMLFFQVGKIVQKYLIDSKKQISDKFVSIYVLASILVSVCVFLIPSLIFKFAFPEKFANFGWNFWGFWSVAILEGASFFEIIISIIVKLVG